MHTQTYVSSPRPLSLIGARSASARQGVAPLRVALVALAMSLAAVGCGDDSDARADGAGTTNNSSTSDANNTSGGSANNSGPVADAPPLAAGEGRADAPRYGARGAHAVGYQRVEVAEGDAPPRVVRFWYPAAAPGGAAESIAYAASHKVPEWAAAAPDAEVQGNALRDAPLVEGAGRLPVVVFSHGFGLDATWYSALTEHYASHGFVVVAPEHVESDWLKAYEASLDRPADVTWALDLAEALSAEGAAWAGRLDTSAAAVVGHSYGGYTALASAGARWDVAQLEARCGALAADAPEAFLCAPFAGQADAMAEAAGLSSPPEGLWPTLGDARVAAAVPISGDAYIFGEQGLAQVQVPVMAISGTADFAAPWAWGAAPSYAHTSGATRALVGLEGGSHFVATNVCDRMPWVWDVPQVGAFACLDPVWDKPRALDLIQHFSTAFLRITLQDDAEARAALDPAAAWAPGVRYEAAGLGQ